MILSHNIKCALIAVALFAGSSIAVSVWAEHSPSSSDVMKTDSLTDAQKYNYQSDDERQNIKDREGSTHSTKTIKGELFRIDNANYFVKTKTGAEVRLHTDKTTDMRGDIKKGDQVEARVNEQNHALSIQAVK